jgi:2-oxoisovalerate dehydrogenase E1 component
MGDRTPLSVTGTKPTLDKKALLKIMATSREGDRREGILHRQSKGWFQISSMGHEAIAAIAFALREDDYLFPYYRDRALALARGQNTYDLALDFFAKKDSSQGGRQMPCHFSSRKLNLFSVGTPTGCSLLPACGTAWAMKLEGKDTVCAVNIGDAASRQGEFYEALCFAVQEKLPVVFSVEDNHYGISTPTQEMIPTTLGIFGDNIVQKVNGRIASDVLDAMTEAVDKARRGHGPTLLWFDVDRLSSHTSSDDHRVYRSPEDIEAMNQRDPIKLLTDELIASGEITAEGWQKVEEGIKDQVFHDYELAEKAEDPRPVDVTDHAWGELEPMLSAPIRKTDRTTIVQALNTTLEKALESDPKVILMGEDIEDPKGGVFGVTKGLSALFPKQVHNSPLAEATIVGAAVGMAAYGYRPVFEIQFIDFITPAWNQITANLSTLRWRTNGDWTCPVVIYAPYGAYLPGGGLWHSQSNEGGLAHITGLCIAIPSTPEDAAGLLWTAIHGDDPTFVLVPKHIFRKPLPVTDIKPVPFGKARMVREGDDVTVVTWGNCLELAEAAAERLGEECKVEIIDLRSIVPCDYDAITQSVAKTGRLVVVHEDMRTGGFGQSIITEMTSDPARWNLFLSPPQLVARLDVPIGFNPIYEFAALPDVEQVVKAIRVTME